LQSLWDTRFRELAEAIKIVYKNQVEISKDVGRLRQESFVLGRLLISPVNDVLVQTGIEDLVTEQVIQQRFKEWDEFRNMPNYANLLVEWLLGHDIATMPKQEVKEMSQPVPSQEAGELDEFGGDYVVPESSERDQGPGAEVEASEQKNAVPAG